MTKVSNLKRYALAQMGILMLLSACGGGGGSSSATSSQLIGSVVDGYIEKAKVCLDLNSNGACDTGEPTATTNAAGAYKLDVAAGTNITGLSVIAEIPDTALDSDDGGKTLAQAGKSAYTMATSAEQPSVITPVTTLIVGKVKSDNISMAQATSKVLEQLGLPADTNPHEDHVAKGNTLVHQAAKQVAGQLQQAQRAAGTGLSAGERWSKIQQAREAAEKEAGLITKTGPLKMPTQLTEVSTGQVIAYTMTGAKGQPIQATAMLFTPKATQPAAGWPLIVFGHGTVGVGPQCAPSVTMHATSSWDYAPLVATLVSSGFAVVAPDYEGLGRPDMGVVPGHPYLDLRSAGLSMALAAVAAKKMLTTQLSGSWATLGHSQGGHAALAGAQFSAVAAQRDPTLNYRGAVAIAPASQLLSSVNAISQFVADSSTTYNQALNASASSNLYGAYLIKGTQSTGSPISPEAVLGEKMLSIYKTVEATCLNDFSVSIGSDIHQYAMGVVAAIRNYAGLKISAVNEPKIAAILAGNDPGQVKLPGSSLIVQGSADTTVLPVITQSLVDKMKAKGSSVTLSLHNSTAATHSGVLGLQDAQNAIAAHLRQIFANTGGGGGGSSSGGGSGSGPSPVSNSLAKYAGTYDKCEGNVKETINMVMNASGGLDITEVSDVYSANNCVGTIMGSFRWTSPAVAIYQGKSTATIPSVTASLYSDSVDNIIFSSVNVSTEITGFDVVGNCIKYSYFDGSTRIDRSNCFDLTRGVEAGAFYLTSDNQNLVLFSRENGILNAENVLSRKP